MIVVFGATMENPPGSLLTCLIAASADGQNKTYRSIYYADCYILKAIKFEVKNGMGHCCSDYRRCCI
jgi:hypothetical protein